MKKLWGIRHIRWLILVSEFHWWWFHIGSKYWIVPNQSDFDYLDAVWEGRA